MPIVKLADIAQKLQLSIATVSRALNPVTALLISAPVRLRIQQTAAKMGYVPNPTAQQLVKGRSYTLGVVVATAFNSLFLNDQLAKLFDGVYTVLQTHPLYGCKWVLLPREKSLSEVDRYLLSSQVDGLIIATQCDFSTDVLYGLAEQLQARSKRPVVAINLPERKGSRVSVVTYDNRQAAHLGVTHLIRAGRRQIGLIYADNNSEETRERIEGYKQALSDHGFAIRPDLSSRGDFTTPGGNAAARELMRRSPKCDALFCLNDEMAIGALSAIRTLKKKCPKDIAVMGFDGVAVGEYVQPRLTTVAQPTKEMAQTATQLLIDRIEHKRTKSFFTLPATLMLRESA